MFTELAKDTSRPPLITYVILLTSALFSLINLFSGKFNVIFRDNEWAFWVFAPFQHGFGIISTLLHWLFVAAFLLSVGRFAEKILGAKRYLVIYLVGHITYVILQYVFDTKGYGLTPILIMFAIIAFAILAEAKQIKGRVVHEKYYQRINSLALAYVLSTLLVFSFLPVYYDVKTTDLFKGVFDGNFYHFLFIILAMIVLVFLRRAIKMQLLSFNKRKHFRLKPDNKKVAYISLIIPITAILALIIFG